MKTNLLTQVVRTFIRSAGALLLGLALAMMLANFSRLGLTRPRDPIFEISITTFFWCLAGLELAAAWVCLFTKDVWLQATGIVWLSAVLVAYWFGLRIDGKATHFSLYVTSLADAFAMSPVLAYAALKMVYAYLLVGGGSALVWLLCELREDRNQLKGACNYCGGHIAFPASSLGRVIPCPHCQKTITLRKPENLKISCYFCKGHIEFPAHAIGEKLKCPHCHMDITLKEPA
jgi:hypothetical protein